MSDLRTELDSPPEQERLIWCEWLRRHGINPNGVARYGWIERRPAACQIAYLGYALDADGKPQWDSLGVHGEAAPQVVQMEGPPLPFPTINPS